MASTGQEREVLITIFLFDPREPGMPGTGRVSVAFVSAVFLIAPPLRVRADGEK